MSNKHKLLVIQVAGLGHEFLEKNDRAKWRDLTFYPLETVFPALTCPVQASFRTASPPSRHGVVANGWMHRAIQKVMFWEQAATEVEGPRIWDSYRQSGKTVAMLFWQQSLGENADIILSPAPIHKHHGGMILDCYSRPRSLYESLCDKLGPFPLRNYWGPSASVTSSQWIAQATCSLISHKNMAPDLCFTYLPALDYDLQRYGTDHARSLQALDSLISQLDSIHTACDREGYDILIFGDYAIGNAMEGPVFPNRMLRRAELLATRDIRGMLYPDIYESSAFSVADHEIAHVYVREKDMDRVASTFRGAKGIEKIICKQDLAALNMDHHNSGDIVLVAEKGYWMAYPWWQTRREAPEYASHVDIHNKPGYDPCELFGGLIPGSVSSNYDRIMGSHGRVDNSRCAAWTSNFVDAMPATLLDLATNLGRKLEQSA